MLITKMLLYAVPITTHNLSQISRTKLDLSTAARELGVGVVVLPEQLRHTVVPVTG